MYNLVLFVASFWFFHRLENTTVNLVPMAQKEAVDIQHGMYNSMVKCATTEPSYESSSLLDLMSKITSKPNALL